MTAIAKHKLTEQEYLAIEREAPFKSEFYEGEMFAMAGTSRQHATISMNLSVALGSRLRGRPCSVFGSDLRLHVSESGLYTYPDITALCHQPELIDDDTLLNPSLIIEILSPSTERYDRGKKFALYQAIASLSEYVLVSQTEPRVERFTRHEEGQWLWVAFDGLDATLRLDSIGCEVPLSEIYYQVEFPPAQPPPEEARVFQA